MVLENWHSYLEMNCSVLSLGEGGSLSKFAEGIFGFVLSLGEAMDNLFWAFTECCFYCANRMYWRVKRGHCNSGGWEKGTSVALFYMLVLRSVHFPSENGKR